ncbi:hypothetical protein [Thalassospira alkalitolerans]|uniref:Bbp19-like phage domain-containing protein n=1 Tax=Thalassospira alkalitolerans TaxID=1293890 RepID=A0A1Y2LA23_9PROT|nr:hypothetical protein [Thalassospira alkalitolerans]OSQ47453.1 hypothetical protein TALK_13035 [Thalassospira alkalitolerans]
MTGWDWFEDLAVTDETADDHWRHCFASRAGQKVLADLDRSITRTALGPQSTDRAIWMREGQRALVLQIARLAQDRDGDFVKTTIGEQ